ncbi:MAG: type IX secretion system membrane protein PorP/SprF [Saprospiraceae bacterium]|nr:type IX secretion system membrane protein PorP/SprF [Saprospiraceae bacterium]
MTKLILLSAFLIGFLQPTIEAQQLPLLTQYPEYYGLINPASVNRSFLMDNGRNLSIGGLYYLSTTSELQDIAPETGSVRAELIVHRWKYKFLLSSYFQYDKIGITKNTDVYLRGAYIHSFRGHLSKDGLVAGVNFGFNRQQFLLHELSPNLIPNDPKIGFVYPPSVNYKDLGLGLYYYRKWKEEGDYFYGGLSAPRIKQNRLANHYYALLGFSWAANENYFWEFSTWVRYVERVPRQTSINTRLHFHKVVWLGIGGIMSPINKPFLTGELGLNCKAVRFGIAYTYLQSDVQSIFGNALEFNLSYALDVRPR